MSLLEPSVLPPASYQSQRPLRWITLQDRRVEKLESQTPPLLGSWLISTAQQGCCLWLPLLLVLDWSHPNTCATREKENNNCELESANACSQR